MHPHQLAGRRRNIVVVDSDRQPVHPGLTGTRRGAALCHREPGELTVGVNVEIRPQRVQPGGFQPLLTPVRQVASGRLLQRGDQIAERGIAERMDPEVVPQPCQELLQTDVGDKLLEHRSAFGVGDAVEVHLDRGQVGDIGGDGVRRRQLILAIRPRLLDRRERRPGLGEFGGLTLAQHRREGRERLVEPQVVPPGHGDQVPEPHVRHLVQHRLGAPLVGSPSDLAAEDVVLEERHRARVFHCAGVELGNEQLIVFAERVRQTKVLVVEAKSLLSLGEQPLGVHVLRQRGPAVDAQRDLPVFVDVGVLPFGIRAGDQRHQIGAHPRSGGKSVHAVRLMTPSRRWRSPSSAWVRSPCMSNVALRSGWSKQANMRLASAVSNCEYR